MQFFIFIIFLGFINFSNGNLLVYLNVKYFSENFHLSILNIVQTSVIIYYNLNSEYLLIHILHKFLTLTNNIRY